MANNEELADIFLSNEAKNILKDKYVLFIGDSGENFSKHF